MKFNGGSMKKQSIKFLLNGDTRGERGYRVIDDKTIVINNSRSYMLWPETEQFLNIISMCWERGDIIESVEHQDFDGDEFYDSCLIKFRVPIDKEIEVLEAF